RMRCRTQFKTRILAAYRVHLHVWYQRPMPELPEVETMRRGILDAVGSRIAGAERVPCRRRPIDIRPRIDRFRRRVVDRVITDIGRIGKRVVVHLDSNDAIVLEPRMTGLVLVADPPSVEHLRFRCTLAGGSIS